MALLDNSGDIILDAVLTEQGRKRMANGQFQIVKYSFGDDEINYNLYDKNHASGSAYYDLEIMQTPVFEAHTGFNANINYGLLTLPNPGVLYLPMMVRNDQVTQAARPRDGIFILAVHDGVTADALVTAFGGMSSGGDLQVLRAGERNGTKIILETGLHTEEIAGTAANVANYIVAQGLRDKTFHVSYDNRFISRVLEPAPGAVFNNNGGDGEAIVALKLRGVGPGGTDKSYRNHVMSAIRGVPNLVVRRLTDARLDTATSNILGPRATVTALNFDTTLVTDDLFSRYGTSRTISGVAGKSIDTMVKITGTKTGVQMEIPIRVFKKNA
tara:strand:- start:4733 stop:5716 length:984 start_codon:yes stop_codon:yes gene_type:complete